MAVGVRHRATLFERTPDMVDRSGVKMAKAGLGPTMCTSYKVLVVHEPQGVIAVCSPSSTAIEDTTCLPGSMQSGLGVP